MAIRLTRTFIKSWLWYMVSLCVLMLIASYGVGVLMLKHQQQSQYVLLQGELAQYLDDEALSADEQHQLSQTLVMLDINQLTLLHHGQPEWTWQGPQSQWHGQEQLAVPGQADWRVQLDTCWAPMCPRLLDAWFLVALPLLLVALLGGWLLLLRLRFRLRGLERLLHRARKIAHGERVYASKPEWPHMLGNIIDRLQHDIEASSHERIRFDTFIRNNAFLDAQTGLGNRQFFDSRLEALLKESEGTDQGAILLLQIRELAKLDDETEQQRLLVAVANALLSGCRQHSDAIIARRNDADFAVLLPHATQVDTERLANRLMRHLKVVEWPIDMDAEQSLHMGVVHFSADQRSYQIMSEADMALRAAQMQGANTWFMYERDELPPSKARGSVRWRVMLEDAVRRNRFLLVSEPVLLTADNEIHHYEILARLRDNNGQLIPANVFLPMAARCGLLGTIDHMVVNQVFKLMKMESYSSSSCSINLNVETLLDEKSQHWLFMKLLEYRAFTDRLLIELPEFAVGMHQQELAPVLQKLKQFGIRITVDRVGQHVVDNKYMHQLPIDFLKLHASLTHNINSRLEHQVVIRSLSANGQQPQVFAQGVEQQHQWELLKMLGVYGGQGRLFTNALANTVMLPH